MFKDIDYSRLNGHHKLGDLVDFDNQVNYLPKHFGIDPGFFIYLCGRTESSTLQIQVV